MKQKIIALIAASGFGKTELIKAVTNGNTNIIEVRSFTTRQREPRDKDGTYEFITREELDRRLSEETVVQYVEYSGNFYGNDQKHFDAIEDCVGILAMTEAGANTLIRLGHDVRIVKVIAISASIRGGRSDADNGRTDHLRADATIVNNFAEGGLHQAIRDLETFIATAF